MRIRYEDMKREFERILIKKGVEEARAKEAAEIFADSSADGVYSHGYLRFPRVVEYIEKGYIDVHALPETEVSVGAAQRWNGHLGLGMLNAKMAMARAVELAGQFGIGMVAMHHTNHWMRGGTYGWQAADAGCIGICWTNTGPIMPAWGARDSRIGNNPFILAVPRKNGEHVVVDTAMALYSYGKLETTRLNGEQLPYAGGFDAAGNLTCDPAAIEETMRVLPIGYWKGSGMSIAFDLIANMMTLGNTVTKIREECEDEYGLSQVFIAIDPALLSGDCDAADELIAQVLADIHASVPDEAGRAARYPGESTLKRRKENMEKGIPVKEEIWNRICAM